MSYVIAFNASQKFGSGVLFGFTFGQAFTGFRNHIPDPGLNGEKGFMGKTGPANNHVIWCRDTAGLDPFLKPGFGIPAGKGIM